MAQQDHEKGWGNMQMKCNMEQFVKEKHERKNITSWWFKTYENIEEIPAESFVEILCNGMVLDPYIQLRWAKEKYWISD